jgi:arylamine N-acetyltransferase
MDEVQDELAGNTMPAAAELEPIELAPENVVALPNAGSRPMFDSDAEKYRWLLDHTDEVATEDENWLTWYRATAEWQDVFGGGRRSGDDGDFEVAAR